MFSISWGLQVILLGKPAPIIYESAMQLLGLTDPREVVAIGDSLEHDIAGLLLDMGFRAQLYVFF